MKKRYLTILMLFIFMLTACSQDSPPIQPVEATMPPAPHVDTQETPRLQLSVNPKNNAYNQISDGFPDDLTEFTVTYLGVSDVTITLGNESLPLENALTTGRITPEEMIAYAQLDANEGYCFEYPISTNGLTKLVYNYYEQFDLVVFYDVYETPDGKQHLIKELNICPYYEGRRISFGFSDLDREDWGLTIQPIEITPDGFTLAIIQSGGQQIGNLNIIEYAITSKDEQTALKTSTGNEFVSLMDLTDYQIQMDGISSIPINWSESYGTLPAGDYTIWLNIMDVYDESQVHPLMKNFQDLQGYYIDFSIP